PEHPEPQRPTHRERCLKLRLNRRLALMPQSTTQVLLLLHLWRSAFSYFNLPDPWYLRITNLKFQLCEHAPSGALNHGVVRERQDVPFGRRSAPGPQRSLEYETRADLRPPRIRPVREPRRGAARAETRRRRQNPALHRERRKIQRSV